MCIKSWVILLPIISFSFSSFAEKRKVKKNIFLPFSFVADMEAECSDDVMKLRVKFNDTFSGLIYSAGKLNF